MKIDSAQNANYSQAPINTEDKTFSNEITKENPIKIESLEVRGNKEIEDTGKRSPATEKMLDDIFKETNKYLEKDQFMERTIHNETKAIIYTLKDRKTNEVIWEFPPKNRRHSCKYPRNVRAYISIKKLN